jgi:hypothetical protein
MSASSMIQEDTVATIATPVYQQWPEEATGEERA